MYVLYISNIYKTNIIYIYNIYSVPVGEHPLFGKRTLFLCGLFGKRTCVDAP